MITQFYFAMGVWGRQGMNHLREKNESHNVSLLVMIGYVIRPEEETRLSDVFTLNSLRERSSMLGSLLRQMVSGIERSLRGVSQAFQEQKKRHQWMRTAALSGSVLCWYSTRATELKPATQGGNAHTQWQASNSAAPVLNCAWTNQPKHKRCMATKFSPTPCTSTHQKKQLQPNQNQTIGQPLFV